MGRRPAGAVYALLFAVALERAHHVHAWRWTLGFGCHHPSASMPAAFSPNPHRFRRCGADEGIPLLYSTAPAREVVPIDGRDREKADRKSILLLNRRKLPRKILSCRADAKRALGILWEAYPHLAFSLEENRPGLSFEQLVGILDEESSFARVEGRSTTPADTFLLDGKSIAATMEVFRKAQNVSAALQLLHLSVKAAICNRRMRKLHPLQDEEDDDNNELRRIYKSVVSLLGRTNRAEASSNASHLIMHILHHHMPNVAGIQPGAEIHHAGLNALGRLGKCYLILELLREMESSHDLSVKCDANDLAMHVPPVDRMAYQTAISSLARRGHCKVATELLSRMQANGFEPDTNIYNELLVGIAKEAGRSGNASGGDYTSMSLQILQEMGAKDLKPTQQAYNSVVSACGKEGRWNEAASVAERAGMSSASSERSTTSAYFASLQCFQKNGSGKDGWWEIGRYRVYSDGDRQSIARSITIGIQPHRNPVYNGLSLVFFDEESRTKLGRILLKNSSSQRQQKTVYHSSLVGMEVNKSRRGEGLSKVLVAIWLRLCLETDAYPRAAIMRKPLISYVLNGFDFIPHNGGCRVELIRLSREESGHYSEEGFEPQFGLHSPSKKSLQGLFSQRVLRTQNIAILGHPPVSGEQRRGTFIYLKTHFEHPISIAENAVDFDPHPLASEEYEGRANEEQRQRLEDQLHSVLRTRANGDAAYCGELEFFANRSLLKKGFLSYAQYTHQ